MKYNYILVFIVPVLVFVLLEVLFRHPGLFFGIAGALFLLISLTQIVLVFANRTQKDWWNFLILPLTFSASLLIYVSILNSNGFNYYLIHGLFFICAYFLYYYFKNIYYILARPALASGHFLENISSFGNFLALFFFASSIYAMRSFLATSVWVIVAVMPAAILLIIYQVTWANKIKLKEGITYIILGSLLLSELAITISFLPLNFNTIGLILAICYYVLIGFIRFFVRGNLNKGGMKFYLVFGIISLVVLLFSANWV